MNQNDNDIVDAWDDHPLASLSRPNNIDVIEMQCQFLPNQTTKYGDKIPRSGGLSVMRTSAVLLLSLGGKMKSCKDVICIEQIN